MSNKEKCLQLINTFDEQQLSTIASMIESFKAAIEEAADDAFCNQLYQNYLDDPDPHKHDTVSFDEALKECGLTYDDLQNGGK